MRRKRGVEAVHEHNTQLPRVIHDEVRCVLQNAAKDGETRYAVP